MKIVNEFPPNYEKIKAHFGVEVLEEEHKPIFTYGDCIYNPHGIIVSEDLVRHEETHEQQQAKMGIEEWWDKFLADEQFRMEQEAQAYAQQWLFLCGTQKNREVRFHILWDLAVILKSEMYGKVLTHSKAMAMIKSYAEQG